jgi:hypothetical protein
MEKYIHGADGLRQIFRRCHELLSNKAVARIIIYGRYLGGQLQRKLQDVVRFTADDLLQ